MTIFNSYINSGENGSMTITINQIYPIYPI